METESIAERVEEQLRSLVSPLQGTLRDLEAERARLIAERTSIDRLIARVKAEIKRLVPQPETPSRARPSGNGKRLPRPQDATQQEVLRLLREAGEPLSQRTICQQLEWTSGKASQVLAWMRENELLRLVGEEPNRGGPPSKVYAPMEG